MIYIQNIHNGAHSYTAVAPHSLGRSNDGNDDDNDDDEGEDDIS